MKSAVLAAAVAAALPALLPAVASAATFAGSFSVTGDALRDPGLVIEAAPATGSFGFDLEVGQSKTLNLFDIWTNEGAVNADDRIARDLDVAFDFSAPASGGSIVGKSLAEGLVAQHGSVRWANPLTLAFGYGGLLSIVLCDATFNWGLFGLTPGQRKGADIFATFTYEQAPNPAPVPLPATLALLGTALGGLGLAGRRKRAA